MFRGLNKATPLWSAFNDRGFKALRFRVVRVLGGWGLGHQELAPQ